MRGKMRRGCAAQARRAEGGALYEEDEVDDAIEDVEAIGRVGEVGRVDEGDLVRQREVERAKREHRGHVARGAECTLGHDNIPRHL